MTDQARSGEKKLIRTIRGEVLRPAPIWLMRQAGRYLPEYRELRARSGSFLEFCYNPKVAAEATLQPIRRFGFDAAILFSDILVVPDAFGQKVSFESGEGPRLEPIETAEDIRRLHDSIDLEHLSPVFEALDRIKQQLPSETALIGFCGAPWTVASYMIAGRGTPDQAPARLFAYRFADLFQRLIDRLVEGSIAYLGRQIEAGVDVVQIFDTWAGVLPALEFERWCRAPITRIIAGLRDRFAQVPIIVFPRGAGLHLSDFAERTGADVIGLDSSTDLSQAMALCDEKRVFQGNLDPLALLAGGAALEQAVRSILSATRDRAHVFNLGHGILPETPIANVEHLVRLLRAGA
ncbi:MAG: uroporphyrinogen decarboxylase [Beijerinckiaceae bacterium]